MFILFDAQCQMCRRPFKAEADTGPKPPADRGQYLCSCPKCYAPITLRGEHGAISTTTTRWAIVATAISGTNSGADVTG